LSGTFHHVPTGTVATTVLVRPLITDTVPLLALVT